MWAIVKSWLTGNAIRLLGYGLAALSVSALVLGIRQSGKNAVRLDNLKTVLEVKDEQLRAAANAPRTRADLVGRLRDGKF